MPIDVIQEHDGIAEVVIDHPPVNALDVAGWFELADALIAAGRVPTNRVAILRATGRGFCAGVDIKEINAKGDEALVGVNRGCAAAFAAVYDCEVPVIAAVQGFCLGGGIGLVGNADMVVASEDATFGLPEVDRGALGAATHLARLVPQHAMRKMVYTAKPITAAELATYGSVAAVVPPDRLHAAALELAADIAAKSPTIIRRAKESLNGIDPVDVKRSYRFEQGFTYELHVRGVADEQRAAFVEKRDADTSTSEFPVSDKRTTIDDIVGELRSGMTHRDRRLGLAPQAHGRRARHLPLRPDRPHRRRLRRPRRRPALRHRQGAQGGLRVRDPRLHRARSALARRAPARAGRRHGGGRGHVLPRPPGRLLARPLPAHPGRVGLRRPDHQPRPATGPLPLRRGAPVPGATPPTPTSSWWPCRPSTSMPPSSTPTGPTPPATARC